MSFTVLEWESGMIPAKVDGVCCDILEGPKLSTGMMILMKCRECGKIYRNPRKHFWKIRGNPKYDATAQKKEEVRPD